MSASINFNFNIGKNAIKEYFDGLAKVELAKRGFSHNDVPVVNKNDNQSAFTAKDAKDFIENATENLVEGLSEIKEISPQSCTDFLGGLIDGFSKNKIFDDDDKQKISNMKNNTQFQDKVSSLFEHGLSDDCDDKIETSNRFNDIISVLCDGLFEDKEERNFVQNFAHDLVNTCASTVL